MRKSWQRSPRRPGGGGHCVSAVARQVAVTAGDATAGRNAGRDLKYSGQCGSSDAIPPEHPLTGISSASPAQNALFRHTTAHLPHEGPLIEINSWDEVPDFTSECEEHDFWGSHSFGP